MIVAINNSFEQDYLYQHYNGQLNDGTGEAHFRAAMQDREYFSEHKEELFENRGKKLFIHCQIAMSHHSADLFTGSAFDS